MLRINVIEKSFTNHQIFNHFSLQFDHGLYLLKAESGFGKSTLFNMIASIDCDYEGQITLNDQIIDYDQVSYLSHHNYLLANKTIIDQTSLLPKAQLERFLKIIKQIEFDQIILKKGKDLSVGQQKTINLALTLSYDAKVYLLDEPYSNLDQQAVVVFKKLISELKQDKIILVSDHYHTTNENIVLLADYNNGNGSDSSNVSNKVVKKRYFMPYRFIIKDLLVASMFFIVIFLLVIGLVNYQGIVKEYSYHYEYNNYLNIVCEGNYDDCIKQNEMATHLNKYIVQGSSYQGINQDLELTDDYYLLILDGDNKQANMFHNKERLVYGDFIQNPYEIIISKETADKLNYKIKKGINNLIGLTYKIGGVDFKIVGIDQTVNYIFDDSIDHFKIDQTKPVMSYLYFDDAKYIGDNSFLTLYQSTTMYENYKPNYDKLMQNQKMIKSGLMVLLGLLLVVFNRLLKFQTIKTTIINNFLFSIHLTNQRNNNLRMVLIIVGLGACLTLIIASLGLLVSTNIFSIKAITIALGVVLVETIVTIVYFNRKQKHDI